MRPTWSGVLLLLTVFVTLQQTNQGAPASFVQFVDPFIGTALAETTNLSGNTYPGAQVPWGMASPSPHTRLRYPGGYAKGDPYLFGFGQVHRSGGGCPDLGNILLVPTVGPIQTTETAYQSAYGDEEAEAGYYRTTLLPVDITAEMTATARVAVYRLSYPSRPGDANLLVDVSHSLEHREQPGFVRITSPTELEGWVMTGSHCGSVNTQPLYFSLKTNQAAVASGTWQGTEPSDSSERSGVDLGGYLRFQTDPEHPLFVALGLSYTSLAGARTNLNKEVPDEDFDRVRSQAQVLWENSLSRVEVEGPNEQKTVFSTALYHALLQPSVFSDVTGQWPAPLEKGIRQAIDYTHYTIHPTWDQFRTLHPFLALLYPEQERDMLRSLLAIADETGWLPKWELAGSDNRGMIGDHSAPIVAGAYLKGIRGFDVEKAYAYLVKSATDPASPNRPGLAAYLEQGFIPEPTDGVYGSVATTVEYSYDDRAIARLAEALGKQTEAAAFRKRAAFYKNLYNETTKFLQPKRADGAWVEPFDPAGGPQFPGPAGFVEGNSWNYTFGLGVDQLIPLMGQETFIAQLEQAYQEHRITLNNEPDSATAYGFTYVPGEAWRSEQHIAEQRESLFTASPGGLPGNDDEGSLSSVFLFDALGFFPVDAASDRYRLGTPLFPRVRLYFPNSTLTLERSGGGLYTQRIVLDGRILCQEITHEQLWHGRRLEVSVQTDPASERTARCKDGTFVGKSMTPFYLLLYSVTALLAVALLWKKRVGR